MPVAAVRPCSICQRLNCAGHSKPKQADYQTAEEKRFYGSAEWKRTRAAHRETEPMCRQCDKEGIVKLGELVDHIVPIREGGNRLDDSNLQTLCNRHHNAKRQHERATGG